MGNNTKIEKNRAVTLGPVSKRSTRRVTRRTADVALQFGLPLNSDPVTVLDKMRLNLGPGRILLFLGPSGAGKSTALAQLALRCDGGEDVDRTRFRKDTALIDGVCPAEPISHAINVMASCGLGQANLWLRRYDELSEGQRFRARLARAVGRHIKANATAPLLCDEFGSRLHNRLTQAIAFNLRKLVSRHRLCLVATTNDESVARDLQPDVTIRLTSAGRCTIANTTTIKKAVSFRRRLRIERGCKADYDAFAAMHYRATDELGFVDKIFIMREGLNGEPLGIVVYSHGPLELTLRNRATKGRFVRNPQRLNREMRILRRLVIHPDVRGCGLGHWLVRKTLPLVGTPYVECLANMGRVNPVFEKAGMIRIGECAAPNHRTKALAELKSIKVDPSGRDFVMQVSRRERVRRIVADTVYRWYAATTAGGERRVARQAPEFLAQIFRGLVGSKPVYFLWHKPANRCRKGT